MRRLSTLDPYEEDTALNEAMLLDAASPIARYVSKEDQ
jgi:hypothetical protein